MCECLGEISRGTKIYDDKTLSWAASAVVNTTKTQLYPKRAINPKSCEIIIANQSLATALNVDIGNIEPLMGIQDASQSLKSVLTTISVPASTSAVIETCEDAWDEQVISNVTATASTTTHPVQRSGW